MNDYKAYVTSDVSVRWLEPIAGVSLVEGRIGEERVFGQKLQDGRYLIWATESVIEKAVKGSKKDATAKLAREAKIEGEDLPKSLPSVSGCSSDAGSWSDAKVEFDAVTSAAKVSADRQVGVISAGVGAVPEKVKAKPIEEKQSEAR